MIVEVIRTTLARVETARFSLQSRLLLSLATREGGLGLLLPSLQSRCGFHGSRWESFSYLVEECKLLAELPANIHFAEKQKVALRSQQRKVASFLDQFLGLARGTRRLDQGSPLGSLWLEAFPSHSRVLFEDETFVQAIGERLMLTNNYCNSCTSHDPSPLHHDFCREGSSFYIRRHEALKYSLIDAFAGSPLLVVREPFQSGPRGAPRGKERVDISFTHLSLGGTLSLDIAVQSYGSSRLHPLTERGRGALSSSCSRREQEKLRQYGNNAPGLFRPFVVTPGGTLGECGKSALDLLHKAFPKYADRAKYFLSCALAKGRGAAFGRCFRYHRNPAVTPRAIPAGSPVAPPQLSRSLNYVYLWKCQRLSTWSDMWTTTPADVPRAPDVVLPAPGDVPPAPADVPTDSPADGPTNAPATALMAPDDAPDVFPAEVPTDTPDDAPPADPDAVPTAPGDAPTAPLAVPSFQPDDIPTDTPDDTPTTPNDVTTVNPADAPTVDPGDSPAVDSS